MLAYTWLEGPPALQLVGGENRICSIAIVGVEKEAEQSKLATPMVELKDRWGASWQTSQFNLALAILVEKLAERNSCKMVAPERFELSSRAPKARRLLWGLKP